MNYSWKRADQIRIGATVYDAAGDKGLVWIEQAGDLHLRFHFADHTERVVRRDTPIMFQVCHRRHYEQSTHHQPIDAGKALLKVYRRRYARREERQSEEERE